MQKGTTHDVMMKREEDHHRDASDNNNFQKVFFIFLSRAQVINHFFLRNFDSIFSKREKSRRCGEDDCYYEHDAYDAH